MNKMFKGNHPCSEHTSCVVMVDGKSSIESIYSSLLPGNGFKMDSKTSKYWTNAISKGDKTFDDFKEYVLRGQDYANYIRSVFVDVYYELAPCFSESETADVHEMLDGMMKVKEGQVVSRADIKHYISNTPSFRKGLAHEIVRAFSTLHGSTPAQDVVNLFEDKFLNDSFGTYSLEQLEHDISTFGHTNPHQKSSAETGNVADAADAADAADSHSKSVPLITPSRFHSREDNESLIELYENVVGRNMSAREFILFVNDLAEANDKAGLAKTIDTKIQNHFVFVQDIVHRYLDVDLDREAFIREHLIPAFQNEAYGASLQSDIVLSNPYQKKMTEKLMQLHDTMYGEQMLEDDCAYLFNRVRDRQLGIMNEDLNRLIADFKKETDEIIQKVFDIYMEVYEREPEDEELNGHVTFMRMSQDRNIAEATVKTGLRNALEYHDVLKKRIKKAHVTVHGAQTNPISQSQVFRILEKILAYKDRDDIDSLISQYV
jgi:hypothetical protein